MENQNRQNNPVNSGQQPVDSLNPISLESDLGLVPVANAHTAANNYYQSRQQSRKRWPTIALIAAVVLLLGGALALRVSRGGEQGSLANQTNAGAGFNTVSIPLDAFNTQGLESFETAKIVSVNGQLKVNGSLVLAPVNQPINAVAGQLFYDKTTNQVNFFNGTDFVQVLDSQSNVLKSVGGLTGAVGIGAGISNANGQLSNSGVLSLQGQTGNISFTGGTGILVNGTTLINTGVTSVGNQTGAISIGAGLTLDNRELKATGTQTVNAGSDIAITTDGLGNVTVSYTGGAVQPDLPLNSVAIGQGTNNPFIGVSAISPGMCLVSTNGAPVFAPCPGAVATGNVSTAGGTPGRITKFSGTVELDDSLLSETGTTINIAGDTNLSAGFRYMINGLQITTAALSNGSDICLASLANCAPATGSFIQNGTVQQAGANFNIAGTGTAATLNATTALQLGGANINTAGTLSNVAYLNQNNNFGGNLSTTGTVQFSNLSTGIVQSSTTGVISSGILDRNSPTLLTGTLTVANGGTGLNMITANGLVYGNGTNTAGVTAAGTAGQIVVANASSVPTFVSVSGDIGISATGVVAIGTGVVTNTKLANSSLTVTAGTNLTGGGLVALGSSVTINVANAPTFSGVVNGQAGFQLNGSDIITSLGVLQNVTANANIITSGTLPVARGGTGVATLPTNGQLLIGNGTGYTLAGLTAGIGVVITNGAGAITVSVDNTVCTTGGNCSNDPDAGSAFYIQNGSTLQTAANFNIDGTGAAAIINAVSALQLNGVSINTAGTLSNVAYLNQSNAFSGSLSVTGNNSFSVGTGSVTLGSLGNGLVQANASGVLSSSALSRNSALLIDTLSVANGGTGLAATPTNGQLLIGNGTGYTLANLAGVDGVTITNAAGAITVGLNNTICSSSNPCESPPAGGSTNYIQNGTVQQAGADFNISGGGTADSFNALTGLLLNGTNINTAGTLSNVAYLNQANNFAGNLSVTGTNNFSVGTGTVTFAGLGTGIVQSSSTGVISSSSIDRNSSTLFSNTLSTAFGGTGASSFTANGVLYGNGSGTLNATAAGTSGQLLLANASGVPTFTSVSGDIAISATGVTTIASGSVTNVKLQNSSLTVTAGTNLTGGGLVSLGGTITLNVASAPTFAGNVDADSFSRGGTTVITSSSVLQNVTANANIITSGTLPIARGGTGVTTLPGNGQLLIGNGTGYDVAALTAGTGVTITNAAGAITVSIDNSVCTTANNCPNPAPGSAYYIQNGTTQQTTADFNIDGSGTANSFNAVTAYRLNGTNINTAGTLSNVAYLNQANAFAGNLSITGTNTLTVGTGAVTFGSLGSGLVQANASGVLSSGSVSRNSSALFTDTLTIANGGTGITATPTNGQLLIGNGTGYTLANITAGDGVSITNAAGAITVAVNSSVCSSSNPCTSPPAGGSTNYIQNGTVQQASADFNISGGGTANTFNALSALQINGSNINTAGTLSNVAYLNQANTFSGTLTISTGNLTVTSGSVTFAGLGAGIVQANASGVLSSGAVDRNSATLFSNTLSVANGGTGATGFTANGVLFGNGSGAISTTSAGTSGQLLLANGSGVPTFTSVSGDIAISAAGVTTIQNSSVTNAKLANSSITINSTSNLVGGGTVALGGTLSLSVASSPSFAGTINAVGGYQLNGTDVITSGGTLQNVTTNANIVTSGTFGIARGGTGLSTVPTNGQLLIGNGTGYTLAGLLQGSGITVTTGAGSITVAVDNTICTTANNCGYQTGGGGSGDYIQNSTSQQANSNFNISGTGRADILNAATALQTAGVTRIDASGNVTAVNVTASGTLSVTGASSFTGTATFAGNIVGSNASATNYLLGTLGLGTTSPQAGDALTLANGKFISAVDAAGTGFVNILAVNANNEIQLGAALNIDGGILLPTDGGQVAIADMNLTAASAAGTPNSYTFGIGNTNVLTVYAQSDGAGSATNQRVAIGTSINPGYTLDVGGDINTSTQYRVGGNVVIDSIGNRLFRNAGFVSTFNTGTLTANRTINLPDASGAVCLDSNNCGYLTTTAASTSYIQNTTVQQAGSNFNISGAGVIGTTLNVTGSSTFTGSLTANGGTTTTTALITDKLTLGSVAQSYARLGIINNVATNNGLTVDGAASQSATLFGLKGGSGQTGDYLRVTSSGNFTYLGVNASGNLFFGNGSYTGTVSQGTLTANRTYTLPDADGVLCTTATCAAAGGSYINNGTTQQTGNFNIISSAAGNIGARIQAASGQTADILAIYNEFNAKQVSVNSTGYAEFNSGATVRNTLFVAGSVASQVTSTIQGVSSQTADLLQLKSNSSTVVAKFDANGNLTAANGVFNGSIQASGSFSETTSTAGFYAGVAGGTTRLLLANGFPSQNIQIDNLSGNFRFFTPGKTVAQLSSNGQLAVNNSSTIDSSSLSVNSVAAGSSVAVLQGASGQTADLLRNQNSAGTVLSGFNATGNLYFQSGSYAGTFVQGTLTANRTYTLPDADGTICLSSGNCGSGGSYINNSTTQQTANFNIRSSAIGNIGAIIQGASGQTADLLQIQADDGTPVIKVTSAGELYAGNTGSTIRFGYNNSVGNTLLALNTVNTSQIGQIIRGVVNDASGGDLFQLQTANGNVVASFNSAGIMTSGTINTNGNITTSGNVQGANVNATSAIQTNGVTRINASGAVSASQVSVTNTNTGTVASSVRAIAGQTVDSFQVQDSSGNKLTGIAADGSLSVGVAANVSITPTFTKLANPATAPSNTGRAVSWSPDGQYMTVAHHLGIGITIYKRSGSTFTKLPDPATTPTGASYGVNWSPDGQYMGVAHDTSPFITIYKRSGDTFTKLANPATLPTGSGSSLSWSPDGQYMTVAHATTPYITIYKRSGDTFTKLANPATLPTNNAKAIGWSPDGQYMSVAQVSSPGIVIYKRSGDTFTKLADPAILPSGIGSDVKWSPDGQYMSVAHGISPYITIYKRSGDTFTKLADPAILPTGSGSSSSWSPDGQFMTVAYSSTPFITTYIRSGDTFTKLANPATLPASNGNDAAWSPDGQYMSVAHANFPYVTIYSVNTASFTNNTPTLANLTVSGRACIGSDSCNDTLSVAGTVGVQGFLTTTNLNVTNYLQTGGYTRLDASGNLMNINNVAIGGAVSVSGVTTMTNTLILKANNLDTSPVLQIQNTSGSTVFEIRASGSAASTFVGNGSGGAATSGTENSGFGALALNKVTSGTANAGISRSALANLTTGNYNLAVGAYAGQSVVSGSTNTFVGAYAGNTTLGSGNVFLGYNAGYNETGSNKLYIANSNSATPLIQGDFSASTLITNGSQTITGTLSVTGTSTFTGLITANGGITAANLTATNGQISLRNSSYTGTISQGPLTANRTFTLPDVDGTICLSSGNCGIGGSYINNSTTQQNANFNIRSTSGTAVAARIQGASGGSADLLRITDGDGYDRVMVNSSGYFNAYNGAYVGGQTYLKTNGSADVALTIEGSAGQTADLLSLFNSGGTKVASFSNVGGLTVANLATAGNITQSGGFMNITNSGSIFKYSGSGGDPFYTLQIQDSSSRTLFNFDTSGSSLSIGRTYFQPGLIRLAGGNFDTEISAVSNTQRRYIEFPDADGTVCLDVGNCSNVGGYIRNATSLQSGNFNIQAVNSSNSTARIQGIDGQAEILSIVDGNFGRTLLSVNQNSQSVIIDSNAINYGGLDYALRFGNASSGEGIASKKNAGNGQNGLTFFTSSNARMTILGNGNVCIGNQTCTSNLGVTGTIRASGSITANTTPDIAEMIAAAPDVEAADVVMADPLNTERVVKASGIYNSAAVGVISDGTSSFMINSYGGIDGGKPLVLAGRVPVKVTNENGTIKPGDHLTVSSTTGHAMKATRAGATIGTALGFFNGTIGTVLVLVNPSYYDPFDGNNLQASTATISTLNATNATITNLTVGTLVVNGDITVNGHIVTAGNTPTVTMNTLLCANTTITIDGNDTAGQVIITTGLDCGTGTVSGNLGTITFAKPYNKAPRVVMTPANSKAAAMAQTFVDGDTITAQGFNLDTLNNLAPGTTYRWYYHTFE